MVSEKQKKINDKIAHREKRAATNEAKRAEEREKNAVAMRANRALLTEGEIQAVQAMNTKKHVVSYAALAPEDRELIKEKRAENKRVTEKKIKMELVEDHPALSTIQHLNDRVWMLQTMIQVTIQ